MKKLYAFAIAMLGAGAAFAQITLTQSSYSSAVIGSDTFADAQLPVPQLAPGSAAQEWDFTGVQYSNTRYYSEQLQGTNSNLPGASWYSSRNTKMGALDSLRLKTNRWSGITATGFMRIGETTERYAIGLGQFGAPFIASDSLVILAQDAPYSQPYPLIKFPATYNSSWQSTWSLTVNMELTFQAQSLTSAPFQYKSTTDYNFSVPGFGKASVILYDGSMTDFVDVLLERISGVTTDSFFLNGSPAPAPVLGALQLTQNKITNSYFAELFRPQEINALVLYTYGNDATYTNVSTAQIHILRIPFRTSVQSVSADGKMVLYPNPVGNSRAINVKLASTANGNYRYKLSQITGAVSGEGTVLANGSNELQINLPSTLANGVYWLTLSNDKGEVATAPFRVEQ
ncbi:T9SS type A sorting domain-containing protein [Polluticoccus soli]|uniref:T9SS type A sorting domain-containing protein n=1 Tax=Polluticoccus soli TaxID=3034150 RepID=UPI0023E0E237|nr:T9SS type A sorting domain-containing protein [Flavipsychrobacter sp. JY13-12]